MTTDMEFAGKSSDVILSTHNPGQPHMHIISLKNLLFSKSLSFFQWWEVAVSFRGAATALTKLQELRCTRVQTDSTRDVWVRFVRTKRKNFHPRPQAIFVICSVHFEEHCFTRAFDPSQRRQIKKGSLPTIWRKEERSASPKSERNRRMKEKERHKVNLCQVRVMSE